jgi:hypothetical protein
MGVVSTRKNRHESAPSTLKKVAMLWLTPFLKIAQVNQGVVICVRGCPEPKNRAMKRQLAQPSLWGK